MDELSKYAIPQGPYPLRGKNGGHAKPRLNPKRRSEQTSLTKDFVSDIVGIARDGVATVADRIGNVPQKIKDASQLSKATQRFGHYGDNFDITFQHSRAGDKLTLQRIHAVEFPGVDGTALAVDSITFVMSPQGNRVAIPVARHHVQSAQFEGSFVRQIEKGKEAGLRIATDFRDLLEEFGPDFIESIEDPNEALLATYAIMEAQAKLSNPDKTFHSLRNVRGSSASYGVRATNPFDEIAAQLDAKINPAPTGLDRIMPL